MNEPFLGSAAIAAGELTRHALRTRFFAVHHDVYVARDTELTALVRAKACWLRSRGHGVLAGFSAAALHRTKWIDHRLPATVIDTNRRPVPGIIVWAGAIDDDEICTVDGMRVTTPVRTAIDLARRYPLDVAIAAVDSLARATRLSVDEMTSSLDRFPGRHGRKNVNDVLALVDPRAESPRETALRLLIVRAGYPRPVTQLPVRNEFGVLIGVVDLGWPDLKIAVEYEGAHHRMSRDQFDRDIRRFDEMIELGWIVIRVTAKDGEATVQRRLADAWARRACDLDGVA